MEVSQEGDLANWVVPGKTFKAMGGAMELVHGVENVVVAMTHLNEFGQPKVLENCSLPLTGQRVVNTLITDLAVF